MFVQGSFSHTCRICSQKILCCSVFVINHMRALHNMTLKEYRKQFNFHGSVKKECEKVLRNSRLSNLHIGDMCTFKCPDCKKSYKSVLRFKNHSDNIQKQNCSFRIYLSSCYNYIENIVTHNCQICSKLLLCDREVILNHAYHVHGFKTLEEYTKRTGCILENQQRDKIKNILQEVSQVEKLEEKVGNFCRYKCHKCGHVSNGWRSMKRHFNKNGHNLSKSKKWSNYISKTILHKCLICGKLILNDTQFMSEHMKNAHKLTVTLYIEKYKLNST